MKLVDTETPNPDRFARTADGKIDFEAYKGLNATYRTGELDFMVTVLDSRQRFGHLDLLITPEYGAGERWTEFKNLALHDDPAQSPATLRATFLPNPEIEAEPETDSIAVLTERVEQSTVELDEAVDDLEETMDEVETFLDDDPFTPAPVPVPAMPEPGPHGTHWTEVAPQPVAVATQEVEAPASTDIEDEVAAILGDDSPHVK